MTWALGMPSDTGRTLFAAVRTAGWVARHRAELAELPLRHRAWAVH